MQSGSWPGLMIAFLFVTFLPVVFPAVLVTGAVGAITTLLVSGATSAFVIGLCRQQPKELGPAVSEAEWQLSSSTEEDIAKMENS